jgi:hypothetical protein
MGIPFDDVTTQPGRRQAPANAKAVKPDVMFFAPRVKIEGVILSIAQEVVHFAHIS